MKEIRKSVFICRCCDQKSKGLFLLSAKIEKIEQVFLELRSQMYCQVFMEHGVLLAGGVNTHTAVRPDCPLECNVLSMRDYVDLLVTTVSEFPGNHSQCLSDF